MNQNTTENWRAVLELEADDANPKYIGGSDQMRSSGQILAAMAKRGMLDSLNEKTESKSV